MLHPKGNVFFALDKERRDRTTITADNRTEAKVTQRKTNFSTQKQDHYVNRIALGFLFDVGKVNQPIKLDPKFILISKNWWLNCQSRIRA